MDKYHQPLLPGETYHLFSRAVGNEKLFRTPDNYRFFLGKLKQHTTGVCQLYCYSLLPNHFHLLVRIRDESAVIDQFKLKKKVVYNPENSRISDFIMERFSNCLNSYTKAFNKVYCRTGSLFMDYVKRTSVDTSEDFKIYTWYIHKNAVHHRLTTAIGEWDYDSYHSILSNSPTSLLRDEILERFGNKEAFIQFHRKWIYAGTDILDL